MTPKSTNGLKVARNPMCSIPRSGSYQPNHTPLPMPRYDPIKESYLLEKNPPHFEQSGILFAKDSPLIPVLTADVGNQHNGPDTLNVPHGLANGEILVC